jgi:hypothetical protein
MRTQQLGKKLCKQDCRVNRTQESEAQPDLAHLAQESKSFLFFPYYYLSQVKRGAKFGHKFLAHVQLMAEDSDVMAGAFLFWRKITRRESARVRERAVRERRKVKGAAGGCVQGVLTALWPITRHAAALLAGSLASSLRFGTISRLGLLLVCFGTRSRSPQRARNSKEPAQKKIALDLFCAEPRIWRRCRKRDVLESAHQVPFSHLSLFSPTPLVYMCAWLMQK